MSKKIDRLKTLDRFIELPGDTGTAEDNLPLLSELIGAEVIDREGGRVLRIIDDIHLFPYSEIKDIDDHLQPNLYRRWHFTTRGGEEILDPTSFLFFDTETTGLSGGAGILAFLIGFGFFHKNCFRVVQYFLPDYPDEELFLNLAMSHITPETSLVSYNGKSYDWPLLKNRLTLNRMDIPEYGDHLDSLHPARSLFGKLGEDASLISMEKNLLSFDRGEDIPGYLIPSKYFDYLYDRQPGKIPEIIRHNRLDIISLALVTRYIPEIITRPELINRATLLEGVINHYYRNKRYQELIHFIERVTPGYIEECSAVGLLKYSLALKTIGQLEPARQIWAEVARSSSGQSIYGHLLELAKDQEHRQKQPEAALETVDLLLSMTVTPSRKKALIHRRRRLIGKSAKTDSKSL